MAAIYESNELEPRLNLAIEEALFRGCGDGAVRPVLLFYRNRPSVIIGRNQNPWTECDLGWLAQNRVRLCRRVSGGGAVYHDPGNLNISFIGVRDLAERERYLGIVVEALRGLGIAARLCPRHAIRVGERKVAGSAFAVAGRCALVHACVLVESDLGRLVRALQPAEADIDGRLVPSVSAEVANLVEFRPGLAMDDVKAAVVAAFSKAMAADGIPCPSSPVCRPESISTTTYLKQYRDWDWTFGHTPEFTHAVDVPCEGDAFRVALAVRKARVVDVRGDACGSAAAAAGFLRETLHGLRYDGPELEAALVRAAAGSACVAHLAHLLGTRIPATDWVCAE
ncbi:MAG: hypothetical protein A3K19_01585 [Lentisphaerae bacterium RIFOXYB12_FULL_65_16]|nr:MAG: hypothetical protein A3K18_02880 [Lentisphaerae bacterium RIFOXYA12_64_32]OGV92842.1 MAG: hypothetical protein A3K19_01585 [Lentisphaerae bacterium RIFOXYB12_FULL_65_16]